MPLNFRYSSMQLQPLFNLFSDSLHALPIAVIYITDKCNSRCISCDYWRFGQNEISMKLVEELAHELPHCGTQYVLLSGGEPLQHPQWETIAMMFKERGMRVAMVTSGILIPKHALAIAQCIDEVYISLDGATPESYKSIRGVDGLGLIRKGMEKLAGRLPITFRTTVQRANYREIPDLIQLTRSWGATHHSFLAVDVSTHAAFARTKDFDRSMALGIEDLDPFARALDRTERECGIEFERGYILESRGKLRELHSYFAALLGLRDFPSVRCNAPRFSAVIETDGSVRPCFFLPSSGRVGHVPILRVLNNEAGKELRQQQRLGHRDECVRCVCPAYRGVLDLLGGV